MPTTISSLRGLRSRKGIKKTYDFVIKLTLSITPVSHGTAVLSVIQEICPVRLKEPHRELIFCY